ncbi:MAG: YfhO family protein [Verrucomicrobia bacterium]|nr:MAG: YfhO family protein [Verrucomicrobiota bacterium]
MSETRATRFTIAGAITAGLAVVAFCLILLWHDPLLFWNDDYELSVLPVFADVVRSWSEGHWPLLSPYSWVCGNLAGEFQYGTFSLFVNAAVIFIWKFPLTFPQQAAALSIIHLFVLAIGAFLLARDRRFSIPLSVFVALVASLNGWIICWGATDWFGALGAFTWLPWAWWGAERALEGQRTKWRFLWPAPFVYLLVTGGFPYTVLMLLLLIAWLSVKSLGQTRGIRSILPMLVGVALGFGLSAPAWLAILDLVQGSARELQPASVHWQWLVPPAALSGFILPCWTVNWTDFSSRLVLHPGTELACGLVAPVALIAGFVWRGRTLVRQIKWELILLVLVLVLAMLPTAGLFRWSFRWLPFVHLVLVICAAEALRVRLGSSAFAKATADRPIPAVAALALVVLTGIAMSIFRTGGPYAFPLIWIFLGLAAVWSFSELFLRDSEFQKWAPAAITFLALLATYLYIPPNGGVPKYNLSQELLEPSPLDPRRLYLSIYPWAELTYRVENKSQPVGQIVRPGSTSMWAGLPFINGYSPIRPAGVAREFATTIHGEINPAMGDYLLNYQAGEVGELARLGVDGIVVAREIDTAPRPASEWQLVVSTDEGRVFHRRGAPFARVRSVTSIDSRPNEQFVSATISRINDSRNRVELDVDVPRGDQPALLAFSRPYFRGYEARLENQRLVVTSYRGLLPIVEVPAGSHGRLTLTYRPYWLKWGSAAAVACVLALIFGFFAATSQRR